MRTFPLLWFHINAAGSVWSFPARDAGEVHAGRSPCGRLPHFVAPRWCVEHASSVGSPAEGRGASAVSPCRPGAPRPATTSRSPDTDDALTHLGGPRGAGLRGRRLTPRSVFRETLLSVRPSQKPCGCSLCPSAGEQGSRRQRLAPVCTLQSPAALSKPCTKSPGAQEHKSQLTRVSTSVAKGPGQCVLFDFLIHRGSREGASV